MLKDCHFGGSISLEVFRIAFYIFPSRGFARERLTWVLRKYSIYILSAVEWETLKKKVSIDTRAATSNDEAWAVLLKPTVYQKNPIAYKNEKRFLIWLCVDFQKHAGNQGGRHRPLVSCSHPMPLPERHLPSFQKKWHPAPKFLLY